MTLKASLLDYRQYLMPVCCPKCAAMGKILWEGSGERKTLVRQAEEIMEQDPPVLPVCWEQINDVWWNYLKGYNPYDYFGLYDVAREDIFWLDKA